MIKTSERCSRSLGYEPAYCLGVLFSLNGVTGLRGDMFKGHSRGVSGHVLFIGGTPTCFSKAQFLCFYGDDVEEQLN